jgi:HemK-related putative methylase
MEIYKPSDDSFFLSELICNYLSKKQKNELEKMNYLDMGCGSCFLSESVSKFISKKNILCSDINPDVVKLAKSKNFQAIKSDLFLKISKTKKFDLITFNAPYLPEDKEKREDKGLKLITTGGKKGDEISLKFIKRARVHLNKNGKIFLLISSHTPLERMNKFHPKIVAEKSLFFEKLLILEFN